MSNIAFQRGVRTDLRIRPRRWYRLFFFTWLLFVLTGSSPANATEVGARGITAAAPGLPFAIGDFDGDLRPDWATIQAGHGVSGASNYWIQLRLSTIGRQSIQVNGPAGGLLVEARDVNGDLAVDLVLTTIRFRQPVAVLLNDGHGRFSLTAPAAFPGAFGQPTTVWVSGLILAADPFGVSPQPSPSIYAGRSHFVGDRSPSKLFPPPSMGFAVNPFLLSQAGRAPPREVPHR